ncbi:hypothetical protein ACN38_g5365 [Penicillium nordicum]|uniref:Uncharacterized protein n=1 Tax=Penicillium nordicum TaxID=229535 RepID=A0A0M8PAF1_9EURO|nr:hypothetical protein ACN38_g5365 [Penicillium nordicum]
MPLTWRIQKWWQVEIAYSIDQRTGSSMPQDGPAVHVDCTVTPGYQYRSLYFKIANLPYSIDPHGVLHYKLALSQCP